MVFPDEVKSSNDLRQNDCHKQESNTCFVCSKPMLGSQNLFRKCKHNSACYDCLRNMYINKPIKIYNYPLKCFGPNCNRLLCSKQLKKLCKSNEELVGYNLMSSLAKESKRKIGPNWRTIMKEFEAIEDVLRYDGIFEFGVCPKCGIIVNKLHGCNHMECICGHHFDWNLHRFNLPQMITRIKIASEKKVKIPSLQIYDKMDYSFLPLTTKKRHEDNSNTKVLNSKRHIVKQQQVNTQLNYSMDSFNIIDIDGDISTISSFLEVDRPTTKDSALECGTISDNSSSVVDSWSIVSDDDSTYSFHSNNNHLSYCDIVRSAIHVNEEKMKESTPEKIDEHNVVVLCTIESGKKKNKLEYKDDIYYDNTFDDMFIYEGVKFGRGGKDNLSFRGNQRSLTPWWKGGCNARKCRKNWTQKRRKLHKNKRVGKDSRNSRYKSLHDTIIPMYQ